MRGFSESTKLDKTPNTSINLGGKRNVGDKVHIREGKSPE